MNGPSEETLQRLAGMLPTLADGVVSGNIGGRGIPTIKTPRFTCPACLKLWGEKRIVPTIESKVCKKCKYALKGGAVIFICDDKRYLIVSPKPGSPTQINPAFVGKIVRIENSLMDEIYKNEM